MNKALRYEDLLARQNDVRRRLEENPGSGAVNMVGAVQKVGSEPPVGAQGEFKQAVEQDAPDYFYDPGFGYLVKLRNFEPNTNPVPPEEGVA